MLNFRLQQQARRTFKYFVLATNHFTLPHHSTALAFEKIDTQLFMYKCKEVANKCLSDCPDDISVEILISG